MRILFVCTGNTCRSPMAAGYFRHLCQKADRDDIQVDSAGIYAMDGMPVSENSICVMKDYDIDISEHQSSMLDMKKVEESDLIIVMTASHRLQLADLFPEVLDKTHLLLEYIDNSADVTDPFGGRLVDYKACFDSMKEALDNLFLSFVSKNNE